MSFKGPDWEKDTLGDQTHSNIFQKSLQKSTKRKQKKHIPKPIQNETKEKPRNLKRKCVVESEAPKSSRDAERPRTKKRRVIPQAVDMRNIVKPFKLKKTKFNQVNQTKVADESDCDEENDEVLDQKKVKNKLRKKMKRLQKKNAKADKSDTPIKSKIFGLNVQLLKNKLSDAMKPKEEPASLRDRMLERLRASRFRYLNEQLYTTDSKDAQKLFQNDPYAFEAYHEGYKQQVSKWPLNPVDKIIASIKKLPSTKVIADFGCGEGKLAQSVPNKVHSFDLVSKSPTITACDMARTPLRKNSVDIAVYCLSLMGTNLKDYLTEANRVLKVGGILKIADVESRFEKVDEFIQGLQRYGFANTSKDISNNMFYFLDFKKERDIKNKNKLPTIGLFPCLYKKR